MSKRNTRLIYSVVALAMVLAMAIGGSGLLAPGTDDKSDVSRSPDSPDTSDQPTAKPEFPEPPTGTPKLPLADLYVHPSGFFEIAPPAGWVVAEDGEENFASANWSGQYSVMHAFAQRFDQPVDHDELVQYVENEFAGGLSGYEGYTVTERDYDGDPITADLVAVHQGLSYLVREWAGAEGGVVWVLRVVAPGNYPALLDYFGEHVLPTYRVYPDALVVPGGWESYYNQAQAYTFTHPPDWVEGSVAAGAVRFVDAETGWQVEMEVLVEPGVSVDAEAQAEEWLKALQPDAQVSLIEPATRALGEGYLVSFAYPFEGEQARRGVLLLLNANDAVYQVELRLPTGADDPLDEDAQQRAQTALAVLDTFRPVTADGPIPTPPSGEEP